MNAQEAVERLEELIDIITIRRDDYAHPSYEGVYAHEVPKLNEKIEALSIILESAKYLHEEILEPSQQEEWRGKSGERLSVLYDIPEERIEIMADDLERIGIKEQTNE